MGVYIIIKIKPMRERIKEIIEREGMGQSQFILIMKKQKEMFFH